MSPLPIGDAPAPGTGPQVSSGTPPGDVRAQLKAELLAELRAELAGETGDVPAGDVEAAEELAATEVADETPEEDLSPTELAAKYAEASKQARQELAALRAELDAANAARTQAIAAPAAVLSQEELRAARLNAVRAHEYYCPGCGRLYDYPQRCEGRPTAPHQPIEVVATGELLDGDESAHTPAPDTDDRSLAAAAVLP